MKKLYFHCGYAKYVMWAFKRGIKLRTQRMLQLKKKKYEFRRSQDQVKTLTVFLGVLLQIQRLMCFLLIFPKKPLGSSFVHSLCCRSQANPNVFGLGLELALNTRPISASSAGWHPPWHSYPAWTKLTIWASINIAVWRNRGPTKNHGHLIHPLYMCHWKTKPLEIADGFFFTV